MSDRNPVSGGRLLGRIRIMMHEHAADPGPLKLACLCHGIAQVMRDSPSIDYEQALRVFHAALAGCNDRMGTRQIVERVLNPGTPKSRPEPFRPSGEWRNDTVRDMDLSRDTSPYGRPIPREDEDE